MIRNGSLIKVKPEFEERYIILHKYTFPEVLRQIRDSNIRNYSIYIKDKMLFGYFEYTGKNFNNDMALMAQDLTTQDWWALCKPMMEPLPTRNENEFWAEMEEVFHIDAEGGAGKTTERSAAIIVPQPDSVDKSRKFYSGIPQAAKDELQKSGIQTCSVFYKDGAFYSYCEYSGKDPGPDIFAIIENTGYGERIGENIPMKDLLPAGNCLTMQEVFHTD